MTCKVAGQLMDILRSLQEEQKNPKDYGTGQLLFHGETAFLDAVLAHPGAKASELSERLGITKGAVTQMAARLSDKGLLEEYRQAGNKKEKFFRLTPLGKAAQQGHAHFHGEANARLCEYLCGLTADETSLIFDFLQHVRGCVPFCEFACENQNPERSC